MEKIVFKSPIGDIFVVEENNRLVEVGIFKDKEEKAFLNKSTPLLEEAKRQILEYFDGKRKNFTLPLYFDGTNFQKQVWQELLKIPYGQTITYKQLANNVGSPLASRAVGGANNKNMFLIIVPCHRVIGSKGTLVGYAEGLEIKHFLLHLEKNNL